MELSPCGRWAWAPAWAPAGQQLSWGREIFGLNSGPGSGADELATPADDNCPHVTSRAHEARAEPDRQGETCTAEREGKKEKKKGLNSSCQSEYPIQPWIISLTPCLGFLSSSSRPDSKQKNDENETPRDNGRQKKTTQVRNLSHEHAQRDLRAEHTSAQAPQTTGHQKFVPETREDHSLASRADAEPSPARLMKEITLTDKKARQPVPCTMPKPTRFSPLLLDLPD
ncbi:hypothetical protein RRG08_038615 [Elysia crispata]|uniref:Uncharacterized protein n=1 Tax=Elysia crispata TaxID=231223 RepID=A0AAE1D0B5_9GAST|nr:hypothetical protein RRG08_038615 [Elysia crispata]